MAEQQKVEILRAIAREARLIVMDEPTAALTRDESGRLLEVIRELAAAGTTVVFVSHYLDEVLSVCDTVTVMRNGRIVRTNPAAQESQQSLVNAMVGHEITLEYPKKSPPEETAPVVLEVDNFEPGGCARGHLRRATCRGDRRDRRVGRKRTHRVRSRARRRRPRRRRRGSHRR